MFDDAKVGDKVWSIERGWCEIVRLDATEREEAVEVEAGDGSTWFYYKDGSYMEGENPTLFWDEVKIVPPEKPKVECCKKKCKACHWLKQMEWLGGINDKGLANEGASNYGTMKRHRDEFILNQFHIEGCEKRK